MKQHLSPVDVCVALLGSVPAVGEAAGLRGKSAFPWRRPSNFRDAGDLPSVRVLRKIHGELVARDLPVKLEWLVYGAAIDDLVEAGVLPADECAA